MDTPATFVLRHPRYCRSRASWVVYNTESYVVDGASENPRPYRSGGSLFISGRETVVGLDVHTVQQDTESVRG